jgi:hypothetical protein
MPVLYPSATVTHGREKRETGRNQPREHNPKIAAKQAEPMIIPRVDSVPTASRTPPAIRADGADQPKLANSSGNALKPGGFPGPAPLAKPVFITLIARKKALAREAARVARTAVRALPASRKSLQRTIIVITSIARVITPAYLN